MSLENLYDPDTNKYLPDHLTEDYEEHGHTATYKTEAIMETPIDITIKETINSLLGGQDQ